MDKRRKADYAAHKPFCKSKTKLPGLFLILAGALLFIGDLSALLSWSFIGLIFGIIMTYFGFSNHNSGLVLTGGLITSITLYAFGRAKIPGWPEHWSLLLVFFALSIILLYLSNKQPLTGIAGFFLLLAGIFANPKIKNFELLDPISPLMNKYWPIFLIVLGLIFILKK
jgi:hypothetical protein